MRRSTARRSVGSVASETFAQYAELAGQGVGALFLKYSRDDETEADALGLRYMRRSNHDIREMPDVFTMLGAVTAAATGGEGSKVPAWMMTHPLPEDRFARISYLVVRISYWAIPLRETLHASRFTGKP